MKLYIVPCLLITLLPFVYKSPEKAPTPEHAMPKFKKVDVVEEDVDIGEEIPGENFPPVQIDKDVPCVSSGSSSSSGGSSSGSDSSSGGITIFSVVHFGKQVLWYIYFCHGKYLQIQEVLLGVILMRIVYSHLMLKQQKKLLQPKLLMSLRIRYWCLKID